MRQLSALGGSWDACSQVISKSIPLTPASHDVNLLFADDRNLMRMYVILVLSALLLLGLAFLGAYLVRARQITRRARKRQAVAARLNAVVAQAEQEQKERRAAAQASAALTTVLPAIKQGDQAPRRVA